MGWSDNQDREGGTKGYPEPVWVFFVYFFFFSRIIYFKIYTAIPPDERRNENEHWELANIKNIRVS